MTEVNKFKELAAKYRNTKTILTTAVVLSTAGGVASAQTTGSGPVINYGAFVQPVTDGMVSTINSAGPALMGFVAIIGGFYFVWGRIRSLW